MRVLFETTDEYYAAMPKMNKVIDAHPEEVVLTTAVNPAIVHPRMYFPERRTTDELKERYETYEQRYKRVWTFFFIDLDTTSEFIYRELRSFYTAHRAEAIELQAEIAIRLESIRRLPKAMSRQGHPKVVLIISDQPYSIVYGGVTASTRVFEYHLRDREDNLAGELFTEREQPQMARLFRKQLSDFFHGVAGEDGGRLINGPVDDLGLADPASINSDVALSITKQNAAKLREAVLTRLLAAESGDPFLARAVEAMGFRREIGLDELIEGSDLDS